MSVLLLGDKSCLEMNNTMWRKVLHIGLRYGWKPDGTKTAPASTQPSAAGKGFDEKNWHFPVHPTHGIPPEHPLAYCSDVLLYCDSAALEAHFIRYVVSQTDAQAMASALEKALPHMPEGVESFRDHKEGALFNPNEWFSPQSREMLQKVIALCKEGGFMIEP